MSNAAEDYRPLVLLKLKDVMLRTGLSRSSIYNKLDTKSPYYDSTFPHQVSLGAVSVAWVEKEVEEWIGSRIKMREEI
nr:AlpA family phage regulatory protein [uncultured Halomonas sp.]